MPHPSIVSTLACLAFAATGAASAAVPTQVINAELQDPSTNPSVPHMRIVLDHHTAKPGRVTLDARNESKDLVHELIVVRDLGKKLPFNARRNVVAEGKIHSLGEVSELKPGESGTLTLNLRPGRYLLFCNQPGHYRNGMFTELTIAP